MIGVQRISEQRLNNLKVCSLAVWIELGRKNPRENHYNITKGYNCNTWNVIVSHRVNVDSVENYFRAPGKEK